MILETRRLILRPFRQEDLDRLVELITTTILCAFRQVLARASRLTRRCRNFCVGRKLIQLRDTLACWTF